jgi:hypothetical protein
MTKLGARDRAQLIVFGYEAGLARPRVGRSGVRASQPLGPVPLPGTASACQVDVPSAAQ